MPLTPAHWQIIDCIASTGSCIIAAPVVRVMWPGGEPCAFAEISRFVNRFRFDCRFHHSGAIVFWSRGHTPPMSEVFVDEWNDNTKWFTREEMAGRVALLRFQQAMHQEGFVAA